MKKAKPDHASALGIAALVTRRHEGVDAIVEHCRIGELHPLAQDVPDFGVSEAAAMPASDGIRLQDVGQPVDRLVIEMRSDTTPLPAQKQVMARLKVGSRVRRPGRRFLQIEQHDCSTRSREQQRSLLKLGAENIRSWHPSLTAGPRRSETYKILIDQASSALDSSLYVPLFCIFQEIVESPFPGDPIGFRSPGRDDPVAWKPPRHWSSATSFDREKLSCSHFASSIPATSI
jgi:hypothetical protein